MGWRDTIRKNPIIGVALAGVCLVVAAGVVVMQFAGGGGPTVNGRYFHDLKTGKLFTMPLATMPPVDAPGGAGQGVLAHVYTCTGCTADQMKTVMIETNSPAAAELMKKLATDSKSVPPEQAMRVMNEGQLVAEPPAAGEAPKWTPRISAAGMILLDKPGKMCEGKPGKMCSP